jgi:hypothetical protein
MDTNKHIAKALLNKSFAEAKELVFKSLYAKASLALDEARFAVANGVFNEAKTAPDTGVPAGASEDKFKAARDTVKKAGYKAKLGKGVPAGAMKEEAELDEMAITAARAREHNRAIDRADRKAWAYTNPDNRQGMWKDGKAKSPAHIKKGKALERAVDSAEKKLDTERASKKTYGRGGKVVKEASEQLDEVSPPDMEKMTGSKHTKASFAKQYGKRGKSVMYATAWKLHNKKAGKD